MSTSRRIPVPIKGISSQELMTRPDIVISGYLRRRSAVNKVLDGVMKTSQIIRWPNMYVVLRDGCLYIFTNERATSATKASSLYGFSEVRECNPGEVQGGVEWAFKVVSELELRNSVFYFCAPTKVEMQRWISLIRQEICSANQGSDIPTFPAPVPSQFRGPQQQQQQQFPALPARKISAALPNTNNTPAKPPPRQQKQPTLPTNVELEYEMGDEDGEYDSDYEKIVEDSSDDETRNQTDYRKTQIMMDDCKVDDRRGKKVPVGGRMLPIAPQFSPPPTGAPKPPVNKFQQEKSPSPVVASKPIKPAAAPKPRKFEPPKQQDECYSVERQTSDEQSEEVAYMTSEEYQPFTQPVKAAPLEPMVNEAMWNGLPNDGERLMKSLNVEGVYMIRGSSKNSGQETLLVRIDQAVRKYHITSDEDGRYFLEAVGPHFDKRTEMLRYYRNNCLPCHSAKLTCPYNKYAQKQ